MKTIIEKIREEYHTLQVLPNQATIKDVEAFEAIIQSELERLAERVISETKKGIAIHDQLSKEIVGNNDYHIGAKEQSERLMIAIINIFKESGIIK
jgi:hypothetical protein